MKNQLTTTVLLEIHNDVKDVYGFRFDNKGRQAHKQIEDILRRKRRYEEGICDDIIDGEEKK